MPRPKCKEFFLRLKGCEMYMYFHAENMRGFYFLVKNILNLFQCPKCPKWIFKSKMLGIYEYFHAQNCGNLTVFWCKKCRNFIFLSKMSLINFHALAHRTTLLMTEVKWQARTLLVTSILKFKLNFFLTRERERDEK